jgi:transposase
MFFPEGEARVFLYGEPVNMRLSFDGLHALAKHVMHQDPLSGHLFAFINRRATQIRVLYFDRSGLCVWAKRLEQGRLSATGLTLRAAKWTGRASTAARGDRAEAGALALQKTAVVQIKDSGRADRSGVL